jgi:hypothetical protein
MAVGLTIGCLIGAGWMVWGSKADKLRKRDRLLDGLALRGDEGPRTPRCQWARSRCAGSPGRAAMRWSIQ